MRSLLRNRWKASYRAVNAVFHIYRNIVLGLCLIRQEDPVFEEELHGFL
jgi:hypothetical protein